jgi:hypothetical protein
MANAITLITKQLRMVDEVYKLGAFSSRFDAPPEFVQQTLDANTIKIAKIAVDGLGNYNKATGFVMGDVDLTWETHTFAQDRGRAFQVDDMDNVESLGLAFGLLFSTFMREQVVPELDAYRFNKFYSKAAHKETGVLDKATILGELDQAIEYMDDMEVPKEGRLFTFAPSVTRAIKQDTTLQKMFDIREVNRNGYNTRITEYDGVEIMAVPQSRLSTDVVLNDGVTAGQEAGGFDTTDGKKIHFLLTHKSAAFNVVKHSVERVFAPSMAKAAGTDGVNQSANAWKVEFRVYHDTFVPDNKTDGIYAYTEALV